MTWSRGPRPLRFVRVRIFQDSADVIRRILDEAQAGEYRRLAALRGEGRTEDDPEVQEARRRLQAIIKVLADLDAGLIELVGPPTR